MSDFHNMREERREARRWWFWGIGLIAAAAIIFTTLNYAGVFGGTVVERVVFEESYQRSAGLERQIATYNAQIAELEGQLINPNLDDAAKANINSQLAALRIQLKAAKAEAD